MSTGCESTREDDVTETPPDASSFDVNTERQPDPGAPGPRWSASPRPSRGAKHRRITLWSPAAHPWYGNTIANTRLVELAVVGWITICLAAIVVMLLLLQFATFDDAVRRDVVQLIHGEATVGPAWLDDEHEEP